MASIADRLRERWHSGAYEQLLADARDWLATRPNDERWADAAAHYWSARAFEALSRPDEARAAALAASHVYSQVELLDRPSLLLLLAGIASQRLPFSEVRKRSEAYFAAVTDRRSEVYAFARYAAGFTASYERRFPDAVGHYREAIECLLHLVSEGPRRESSPLHGYFVSMLVAIASNITYDAVYVGDLDAARASVDLARRWTFRRAEPRRYSALMAEAVLADAEGRHARCGRLARRALGAIDASPAMEGGARLGEHMRGWAWLYLARSHRGLGEWGEARAYAAKAHQHALKWSDEQLYLRCNELLRELAAAAATAFAPSARQPVGGGAGARPAGSSLGAFGKRTP